MTVTGALPPVVPMQLSDLDAIMDIEPILFPGDPWPRSMYEYEITRNQMSFYRVIHGQAPAQPPVLAYGGVWMLYDSAHVATIGAHPAWQRCGLGGWLLLHLIEEALPRGAVEVTLEVRGSNLAAQALYRQFGFEKVGRRKRYYRDTGEDALLMTLPVLDADAARQALADLRSRCAARLRLQMDAGA